MEIAIAPTAAPNITALREVGRASSLSATPALAQSEVAQNGQLEAVRRT